MTREEAERYLAEEQGLIDALLGRNRTEMYGHEPQFRREGYETGLSDGLALLGLQRWSEMRRLSVGNTGR
jgi:hypothetical protein